MPVGDVVGITRSNQLQFLVLWVPFAGWTTTDSNQCIDAMSFEQANEVFYIVIRVTDRIYTPACMGVCHHIWFFVGSCVLMSYERFGFVWLIFIDLVNHIVAVFSFTATSRIVVVGSKSCVGLIIWSKGVSN